MSRGQQATPAQNGRPPQRGSSTGAPIAALVSIVGLVLIVMGSVFVMSTFALNGANSNGPTAAPGGICPDPVRPSNSITPNPVVVITPPPDQRPSINGTLLFARTGNIWAASGLDLTSVSTHGTDSAPAWAPDGKTFYVVETIRKDDVNPPFHAGKYYLFVTNITQMNADGSNRNDVYKSLFSTGGGQWYTGVYQPDVSPDGKTFALVSDFGWRPERLVPRLLPTGRAGDDEHQRQEPDQPSRQGSQRTRVTTTRCGVPTARPSRSRPTIAPAPTAIRTSVSTTSRRGRCRSSRSRGTPTRRGRPMAP